MTASKLPSDHPMRMVLNDEMHARPPEALGRRVNLAYIVLIGDRGTDRLRALCDRFAVAQPGADENHFSAQLGEFRVKWERHTEFARYTFMAEAKNGAPFFADTALSKVPDDWLASLGGEIMVADHVALVPGEPENYDDMRLSADNFSGNPLVGAKVAGEMARAFTDFHIHEDGFGRILLFDLGMTPRQRGRTVQRLLELDTYRIMALLTLPIARALMARMSDFESELNGITSNMRAAGETQEPELLDRLTLLHADIVNEHTANQFRFSAARAYNELVALRTSELRQSRIEGLQTFSEFIERRLDPAMRTCEAANNRLDALSERVSHATQLLSTRVDIAREKQNQSLLESMNRRAQLQLRLQETVEGLSAAAITYYIVGLVGYLAEGLKTIGMLPVEKPVAVMASIPIVLLLVAFGVRRMKKAMFRAPE